MCCCDEPEKETPTDVLYRVFSRLLYEDKTVGDPSDWSLETLRRLESSGFVIVHRGY